MTNNYQRLFYVLSKMDNDVGNPSGYLKVEVNSEVAKLQLSLNNLLNRQGLNYQLYGIKKDDKGMLYTVICDVQNINGRADVKINSDINKIGSNKLKLEDINIFAVITQLQSNSVSIKCPLVAYTKGELAWKSEFETKISNKDIQDIKTVVTENEAGDLKDDYKTGQLLNLAETVIESSDDVKSEETEILENTQGQEEMLENKQVAEEAVLENTQSEEAEVLKDIHNEEAETLQDMKTDKVEILENQDQLEQYPDTENNEPAQKDVELSNDVEASFSSKFEAVLTSIYDTEKAFVNEQEMVSDFTLVDNDILGFAQKNFNDISAIDIGDDNVKSTLNMPSLKEELDKSFESYNPFKMKSKSIKWWKINSPGYLNNILFRNTVKSYLLFNPKVMLAHYKYRYIIFGVRNDRRPGREFLICGVPGVYSIDENPFGNMGSWVQLEGYKPKYGAFGYWIILIDPRTGKLMKLK